jgi:hypothetical protein
MLPTASGLKIISMNQSNKDEITENLAGARERRKVIRFTAKELIATSARCSGGVAIYAAMIRILKNVVPGFGPEREPSEAAAKRGSLWNTRARGSYS